MPSRRQAPEIATFSIARHHRRNEGSPVFDDPYAEHFVQSKPWRWILGSRAIDMLVERALLSSLAPIATQHVVRARDLEERLEQAAARHRITQYVNLGAGYDTFAWRRPELHLMVFEVDLEATLRHKHAQLGKMGLCMPPRLRSVPFDLRSGNLARSLEDAGWSRRQPTFFGCKGVSYYLTRSTVIDMLGHIADKAAPLSEIAFDYIASGRVLGPEDERTSSDLMNFTRLRGEPILARFDPRRCAELFGLEGRWKLLSNTSPETLASRYLEGRRDVPPLTRLAWIAHLRLEPGDFRNRTKTEIMEPHIA